MLIGANGSDNNDGIINEKDVCFTSNGDGIPGCWIKKVVNGNIVRSLVPSMGKVDDLLVEATGMTHEDERVAVAREENPINKQNL